MHTSMAHTGHTFTHVIGPAGMALACTKGWTSESGGSAAPGAATLSIHTYNRRLSAPLACIEGERDVPPPRVISSSIFNITCIGQGSAGNEGERCIGSRSRRTSTTMERGGDRVLLLPTAWCPFLRQGSVCEGGVLLLPTA